MNSTRIAVITTPQRVVDWKGKKVMNICPMSNAYFTFPAGTIFTVTNEPTINKRLEADPCPHCGVSGKIVIKSSRKEFESDFQFVEIMQ